MLFRSGRIAAFQAGLQEVVRPGMRVLEVGSGLGTYSFFAARAGADRVTAVESDPVVHVARAVASRNGLAQRVEFVHARAPEGIPAGRYDVVVFEDYPTSFMDQATWELLEVIRDRHLAPGGVLFPESVRFGLAPVVGAHRASRPRGDGDPDGDPGGQTGGGTESATEERPETETEKGSDTEIYGLDWTPLRSHLANTGRKVELAPASLGGAKSVTPARRILAREASFDWTVSGEWSSRGEVWIGLAFWFDLHLGGDRWVCNHPQARSEPWGQWLLPLDPPVALAGDVTATARVWRDLDPEGGPGWMGWSCSWPGGERRGHEFAGVPLSAEDLGRRPAG